MPYCAASTRTGRELADKRDAARLNTPDWLWDRWAARYGRETAHRIGAAHLREAALDLSVKERPRGMGEKSSAVLR